MALSPRLRAGLVLVASLALVPEAPSRAEAERGPEWSKLAPEQQRVLAPLEEDWPFIEAPRRLKWMEIAKRYPSMTKAQQYRLQGRMRQWAALTAEERSQVRERYRKLKQMPPKERDEIVRRWQEYDSLTDEEKDVLRQAHPNSARP